MNSCVCRVLHDHTKCGFVLFCGFENICKWCGLEQTEAKQSWLYSGMVWSHTPVKQGKGDVSRELLERTGNSCFKTEVFGKKKSNFLCIVQFHCYLWRDWAGGREAAQGVLTLYSLHHSVNSVMKSGDLQMYLLWNKNTFFWFGINVSRMGLVTCVHKIWGLHWSVWRNRLQVCEGRALPGKALLAPAE